MMIQIKSIDLSLIRSGKGDCIHLRFIGESGVPHNIIIDTGPTSAAGEFRALVSSILKIGETLDVLFITHYDDDHIGGILKVGDPGFQNIYFNAYEGGKETSNLSALQNQRLFHSLPSAKVHSSVLAGDIIELDGAVIKILSPTRELLSNAMTKMKEADVQLAFVSDWNFTLDELMSRSYPGCDTSPANKASIVFAFEYQDARFLFCGDAPADSIIGKLGHFDLVKLPHHGSSRNISSILLNSLDADTFLICADGTSHPNKQTVAKLIQHYGTVTIYSNYSWWMNGFLRPEDKKYINTSQLVFKKI